MRKRRECERGRVSRKERERERQGSGRAGERDRERGLLIGLQPLYKISVGTLRPPLCKKR